ncbi:hypothetical protein SAMN06265379_10840 [Saccharicrinis carchari]|uniref:DUF4412 domain-containing protein n=1 Tax=Saccharicrinis carchari TaxID=1168039 RepID=A0A521E8W5_SACCC|nr:hypothetical protein [Saccharicrinis carchari]SMO80386.1 hypothetical protein SAMN06265379_10840 [Saccharicrinis carchari]
MKNLFIIALTIIGLNVQAQEAKTYLIKSGYIKYQLSGSTKGTKELWWDDYGRKTCETEKSTTTTKMFGIKNTEEKHATTVIVKDKFWVADYIDNMGSKGRVPMYQEGQDIVGDMTEKEQQEFADEVLASMGGKKMGTESLNGYTCDIIKLMGVKTWIHKGLALKTEGKILGIETNEMFVEFKPKMSVSSSKFNPPSGVQFEGLAAQADAQGFGSLFGGMEDLQEEENEDEEFTPVDYPFDKFSKIVKDCNIEGYRCVNVRTMDGMHVASFMKGLNSIMVMAQSDENMGDDEEVDSFETFEHNGRTCHYGDLEEDNGSAIIVEYPSDDMIVTFMAIPKKSKNDLIKIVNRMQF